MWPEWLKQRIYDNIDPLGYNDFIERIKDAVLFNEPEYKSGQGKLRDDIFATYLGIPQNERHNYPEAWKVWISDYRPTINRNSNQFYYNLDIPERYKLGIIHDALDKVDHNESAVTDSVAPLGQHTISRGMDPQQGEYVSYYDVWDLMPWRGASADPKGGHSTLKKVANFLGTDVSLGLGKPLKFYDRIYLNDYFGVTPEIEKDHYYGGYIRPAYISDSAVTDYKMTGDDYIEAGEYLKNGGSLDYARNLLKSI